MTDFSLHDAGSIALLTPLTPEAIIWVRTHLPEDRLVTPLTGSIAIEHHYVDDIVDGIALESLTIKVKAGYKKAIE